MAGNDFVKGRTNQHLTWLMVDATDYASPESALSAATKIKIWGKLRGQADHNFVSSGTGSLTNDIKHVGPSVLGMYTIALVKADLSDASAAWYDQYIINLSATGAAYQNLIVDGGIDVSAILAAAALTQSMASDAASAAAQANSRVLLVQSRLSDFDSRLVSDVSDIRSMLSDMMSDFQSRVPKAVATNSQLSDLHSDLRSYLVVMSGVQSDVYSLLSDLQSDFQSRVPKRVATDSQLSDLHSDLRSYLVVISGVQSDVYSLLSDLQSDFQSRVPKRVATDSQLSDLASDLRSVLIVNQSAISDLISQVSDFRSDIHSHMSTTGVGLNASTISDIRSAINALTVSLDASNISDIASAVVAALPITSMVSDIYSLLSDLQSDFQSRVPKRVATDSQLSDMASDVKSAVAVGNSRVLVVQSMASDAASAAQQANSRVLVAQSFLSDIRSHVSDLQSDFQSRVPKLVATNSQVSDLSSDIKSAVAGITVTIGASDVSDIASAVLAGLTGLTPSDISNVASAVQAILASQISDILSAAQQTNSRVLVVQSMASDIRSHVSDLQSDFQSRVPKETAARSQVSDVVSDVRSLVVAGVGVTTQALSDIGSRVWADSAGAAVSSRLLVVKSNVSDIYSLLSDVQSDFQSRVPKRVATDSQLSALSSDIQSAVADGGNVSDISDILSGVRQANSRLLAAQSVLSDVRSTLDLIPSAGWDKMATNSSGVIKVVVGSGSTSTAVVLNATTGIDGGVPSAVNDFYNGCVLVLTSGVLAGQRVSVSDYDGATKTLTVTALTTAPTAGDLGMLV